ncbi:MAG: ABC transporter permease [Coriobacteriia bacterium]|nr:ABC transporter permease [Coriobacteriia bacterium]
MAISVGYFLREGMVNFRRNWVMSLGAVITIYLSLLLVGVSLATGVVVDNLVKAMEAKVTIQVFLKDGAAEEDVTELQRAVSTDPMTKSVQYVSKDEALKRFTKSMAAEGPEIVQQLQGNPLPASLDIELNDPRQVDQMVEKIRNHPRFTSVIDRPDDPDKSLNWGQQVVERLFSVTRVIRVTEVVFIVMLAVVSFIFINNTIRLAIYARRKEIGIMRLVGASNWFIRVPFLLEGLTQGLIGAGLAILTLVVIQAAVMPQVQETLRFLPFSLTPSSSAQIGLVLVFFGMLIGLSGSGFALRRYLKV